MTKFKTYITSKSKLEKIAKVKDLSLIFVGGDEVGYVSDSKKLLCFVRGSSVDLDNTIVTLEG